MLLLTGARGSGKTTLLRHWLARPALAGAAVVLNEAGAVALDAGGAGVRRDAGGAGVQRDAGGAGVWRDAAAQGVVAPCLCCEGLPGLAEALEQLFWDRLHRRVPRFDRVVVETAGRADPALIAQALRAHPLLAERYRLEGVVAVLHDDPDFIAQVQSADVLILSHADRRSPVQQARLRAAAQALSPGVAFFDSALGAVCEPEPVLSRLADKPPRLARLPDEEAPFQPRPWGLPGGRQDQARASSNDRIDASEHAQGPGVARHGPPMGAQ